MASGIKVLAEDFPDITFHLETCYISKDFFEILDCPTRREAMEKIISLDRNSVV